MNKGEVSQEEVEYLETMERQERGVLAHTIGVSQEELKGKSLTMDVQNIRPFNLSKNPCKCLTPDYIHIQELDDGNVTVYVDYYE